MSEERSLSVNYFDLFQGMISANSSKQCEDIRIEREQLALILHRDWLGNSRPF